jgi:7-carboxy-7-deazaguanine synthase
MRTTDPGPHYQVHEMFRSIQGEGAYAGAVATFIRLQGCPVGCEWCDAKLTWYGGGTRMTVRDICEKAQGLGPCKFFVITGGEPLLYDLDALIDGLVTYLKRPVHLETSGAFPFKGERRPHYTVLSPKAANDWSVEVSVLDAAREIKYVVDEQFFPEVVHMHLSDRKQQRYPLLRISLMPEGSPPRPEMVQRTIDLLMAHPEWCLSPRLQYAYPDIAHLEGDTNKIISKETARERSRNRNPARVRPLA